jgi:quinol-cytochrome oxidoreductase complex cytochrome b subunit
LRCVLRSDVKRSLRANMPLTAFAVARGYGSNQSEDGMAREQTLADKISGSSVWRSVVRHGYPDTQRNQALIIASNVFLHIHPVKIKRYATKVTYTFCLGGLSFFMFLVLVGTGVLLMFYYIPSADLAYESMKNIETSVTFGQLMRNMHRWSAQGMVIAVFLHMCRVFYTGSYKPPREFNWVVGVLLLVVTFLLSFTGYLLPWDQLALWAITVGTEIGGAAPIVGAQVNLVLRGDYEIGQSALVRFYTLHVIFLPLVAAFLMAVHFWRIRKDGGISGPL